MHMAAKAELKVQNWGNNLAVRIPASVARAARLVRGQSVIVEAVDGHVIVRPQVASTRLTLEQMVAAFDPRQHGGELIADAPRGQEFR
jgi:antitoxin MazE